MITARVLGLDPGDRRIGVAISDELGMLAHPRGTLQVAQDKFPMKELCELIEREKVKTVVIGLPRNMDGSEGSAAEKSRKLADQLRACTACEVLLRDERLSTVAAQRALHASGRTAKNSKAVIDQAAAQFILQGYLDAQTPL